MVFFPHQRRILRNGSDMTNVTVFRQVGDPMHWLAWSLRSRFLDFHCFALIGVSLGRQVHKFMLVAEGVSCRSVGWPLAEAR